VTTIRVLTAEDAKAFRNLRLEALRDSPTSFASSYEDEVRLTPGEFVRRLAPTDESWVLGAFDSEQVIVGCIGWYRYRGRKISHKSHIWGMYVTPRERGKGTGRALVTEALARARGMTQIDLFVAGGNTAAASLYKSFGFKRVAVYPRALCVAGAYIDEELFILRTA
jgi:ribosomal protein S18 acetylase RimI-like enzyme